MREAKEFCLYTYSHGFKFIALPNRKMYERIAWLLITGISILAAVSMSCVTWVKVNRQPTITLTDSPNHPIWYYPFPAITVCNFNTISRKRAFQVAENLRKPQGVTSEELALDLRQLYHLIDASFPEIPHKALTTLQEILDSNEVQIEELMKFLAPTCKELIQRCTWKGQQVPCEKLFEQIKTADGFCCSFNYFALKNHTFVGTSTRSAKFKIQMSPRRVAATGYQTALEAVVNAMPEDYFATPFASYGHRVIVHYPYNFPDRSELSMLQSTQGLIFIGVKPLLYRTDTRVTSLSVYDRKCLFREEGQLVNFEYTYYNCISECRANMSKELCGCVPFYYYYGGNNNGSYGGTRVCNLQDIVCLFENQNKIRNSIPGHEGSLETHTYKQDSPPNNGQCGCLPDCNYCSYKIEGSAGEFNKEFVVNKPTLYGGISLVNQSVFRVFFDDLVSIRNTMSVKFYWHAILGLFGGVLGFFTGFSIVSFLEMIYFFTVRPLLNFLVQLKTKKKDIN